LSQRADCELAEMVEGEALPCSSRQPERDRVGDALKAHTRQEPIEEPLVVMIVDADDDFCFR